MNVGGIKAHADRERGIGRLDVVLRCDIMVVLICGGSHGCLLLVISAVGRAVGMVRLLHHHRESRDMD